MKKIIIIALGLFVIACNTKKKNKHVATVYIIAGKSDTYKWGLKKSSELIDAAKKNKEYTVFTHESMYNDIEDGEWNGLRENKFVSFEITDSRQLQPEISEYYQYLYSYQSVEDTNYILGEYKRICENNNFEITIPAWENKDIDSIKSLMQMDFLRQERIQYKKRVADFISQPDEKIITLIEKTQLNNNNNNLIVRYDYAHALTIARYTKEKGIPYIFFHPPNIIVKNEISIMKKIMSADFLLQ